MEACLVTGEYDYLVKLIVRDTDHYERFLRESLYKMPGIRHSRTTLGLRARFENRLLWIPFCRQL
jgi:Lrp/AsnC family transcriptional regulator, leucine-responsive regulatory protein